MSNQSMQLAKEMEALYANSGLQHCELVATLTVCTIMRHIMHASDEDARFTRQECVKHGMLRRMEEHSWSEVEEV
jgi:hypothetical protein